MSQCRRIVCMAVAPMHPVVPGRCRRSLELPQQRSAVGGTGILLGGGVRACPRPWARRARGGRPDPRYRGIALEGAKHGIRVNAVAPGYTRTKMYERATVNSGFQGASAYPRVFQTSTLRAARPPPGQASVPQPPAMCTSMAPTAQGSPSHRPTPVDGGRRSQSRKAPVLVVSGRSTRSAGAAR